MPLSKHFGGRGEKVMRSMKSQYGEEKGERVFYATEAKRKAKGKAKGKRGFAKLSQRISEG